MNRQRPNLKNGVDLQLQSAFQDGNWPVVIRLAEKRARTLNDQYYEIVKICAESQLDDPASKFAAVTALDKFVKEGAVIKDVDAIDLLDWSTEGLMEEDDFSETVGPLRVRCVKAQPKDKISATRCLESCLLHWDLNSAQQIAAMLDRSFPQERSFLFWNIVITHMLSLSSQAPDAKKKLYGTLALKQMQRAAQLAEQAETSDSKEVAKLQARSIRTEEEILLYYEVVEKHGTKEDFEKLMSSPVFSPVTQFRKGRKELFQRTLSKHKRESDWETVFTLCKDCLSVNDENGEPSLLAADWTIWRQFIDAAAQMKSTDPEVEKVVQELLLKFANSPNLRPIYRRNIILARVSAAFNLASSDEADVDADGKPASLRLRELANYTNDQATNAACFDDIKGFVEKLSHEGMKHIANELTQRLADEKESELDAARVRTLSLKLQYLVSTCLASTRGLPTDDRVDRFAILASAGLKFYQSLSDIASAHVSVDEELKPEVAILVALCTIQVAYIASPRPGLSPPASLPHILRALLLLDHQFTLTPKHSLVALLLVQLHLLVGSASRSREVWETLGVKRTIIDSLGPIFYDRLSTVAPSMVSPADSRGWYLMEMLESHYSVSLKLRMPRRLIEAFEAGNYASIIDIPRYIENLRWSCTRAMSLVEEARTERLLGQQFGDILQDPRLTEVTDDIELHQVIDYGSFPSWESSGCQPIFAKLRLGPDLTDRRAHLSLLAEKFHETLVYKAPPAYKVPLATSAYEKTFIVETLTQVSNSFVKYLRTGNSSDLTSAEATYFDVMSILSTMIMSIASMERSAAMTPILSQMAEAVSAALDALRSGIPSGEAVELMSSFHNATMFRDTAFAAKKTCQYILSFNEREKERDRSGQSSLPKEVVVQIKTLQQTAEAALKEGKGWFVNLKESVYGQDFEPKTRKWIFGEDGKEIEAAIGGDAMGRLVKSWEANAKGWKEVTWE